MNDCLFTSMVSSHSEALTVGCAIHIGLLTGSYYKSTVGLFFKNINTLLNTNFMIFLSSKLGLIKFCFLHCLFEIMMLSNLGTFLTMKLFLSNFTIFFCLLFWPLAAESRAIPSTRDKFGLERSQRACLYVRCAQDEVCVSRNGIPHCQTSELTTPPPTQPPCTTEPCEAVTPVCDQFGSAYPSECAMKSFACNSSQNLTIAPCPRDCYSEIRTRLSSYTQPTPQQLTDLASKADLGTLSLSHLSAYTFPSCQASGEFKKEQCYTNIPNHIFCWCAAPSDGAYVLGTFQSGRMDCENFAALNCSLSTESGELVPLRHGESYQDSCTIHSCNNGRILSRMDSECSQCSPDQVSEAKRTLFARKGAVFQNVTGRDPRHRPPQTLNWYFRRCDRNRGGELTYREFSRCHRRIWQVSSDCLEAVFHNCSGPNSDSILPGQWRRCFLSDITTPPPPSTSPPPSSTSPPPSSTSPPPPSTSPRPPDTSN